MTILDYWPQTSLRKFTPLSVRGTVYPDAGDVDIDHRYTTPLLNAPEYIETKPVLSGDDGWAIREAMQFTPGVDQVNPDGSVYANGIIHRGLIAGVVCETWHVNSQSPGTPILRAADPSPFVQDLLTIDNHGTPYCYRVSNWLKHVGKPWGVWPDTVRCVLCEHHTNGAGDTWYHYVAQRGVGLVEIMGPLQFKPEAGKPGWAGKLYWSGP